MTAAVGPMTATNLQYLAHATPFGLRPAGLHPPDRGKAGRDQAPPGGRDRRSPLGDRAALVSDPSAARLHDARLVPPRLRLPGAAGPYGDVRIATLSGLRARGARRGTGCSRSRLFDRCPLPFVDLSHRRTTRRPPGLCGDGIPVERFARRDGPDHPRHLVRERDDDQHVGLAGDRSCARANCRGAVPCEPPRSPRPRPR